MTQSIRFGIIGSGWRSDFYLRIAAACPDQFEVAGISSRSEETRRTLNRRWGVPAFASAAELVDGSAPAFVVTSVPWAVNPGLLQSCVTMGMPVLSETPPAPTVAALLAVNELPARGGRIQVAEQFHLQPHHAARLAAVRQGLLGTVTQAQVSAGHGYHGISLIRRLLGIGFEPATISGFRFASPLLAGPDRDGPPKVEQLQESIQDIFRFEFDDKLGLLDFTGDQYFSWIRNHRVLIRGERGEMNNEEVSYLRDFRTPIRLSFVRHAGGTGGNLEGHSLQGIQLGADWLYTNPFNPAPLSDEEIAIATCLRKMDHYIATGESFYSLAEASQDHYLNILCGQALAAGKSVRAERMPWAE